MNIISKLKKLIPKKIKIKIANRELNVIKNKIRNTECEYKVYKEDVGKLDKKIAIITGGSGAIGSAICFKLAIEGAIVFIAGRNKENLNSVVHQIRNNGGKAETIELDVTKYDDIKEKFEKIYNKYGRIDILVNNAGGSARSKNSKIVNQDVNIINDILDVNLKGTILCCKEVSKYMIQQKEGRIINIGSTVGIGGLSGFSEYCASKAGVIGFTKSLAMELAEYGICVNCVSPGITNQILWDKFIEDIPNNNKSYINRKGKTDDIANAVEFFCRDESEYIIGQNLVVDGGRSLGLKQ